MVKSLKIALGPDGRFLVTPKKGQHLHLETLAEVILVLEKIFGQPAQAEPKVLVE